MGPKRIGYTLQCRAPCAHDGVKPCEVPHPLWGTAGTTPARGEQTDSTHEGQVQDPP